MMPGAERLFGEEKPIQTAEIGSEVPEHVDYQLEEMEPPLSPNPCLFLVTSLLVLAKLVSNHVTGPAKASKVDNDQGRNQS